MNMTRAILERVNEVELQLTPEFQKSEGPVDQKLMDAISNLMDQEVIDMDDFSDDPTDKNPVSLPGNPRKYPISHDSTLVSKVQTKIKQSGVQWVWHGPEGRFYVYPGGGMTVPVFWLHVYTLAGLFLEQVGQGGEQTKGGPFTVEIESHGSGDSLESTFDSVAAAEKAGMHWKNEMVGMADDREKAKEDFSWVVYDVDNDRMASG